MKLIACLVLAAIPTMAQAQIYNTLTGRFAESGTVYPSRGISPENNSFGIYNLGDTPTMRQQRAKRVAAFRAKVADVLAANNGVLTDDSMQYLRRELVKLNYRNR
jgi:hypothetical protein